MMPQDDLPQAPLGAKELRRIHQILQFLVGLAVPSLAAKAARLGYDGEEHRWAWALVNQALGSERPFEHALVDQATPEPEDEQRARLNYVVVDEFENLWFPRFRAVVRRFLPDDRSEAILDAFFENLSQQPLGPNSVGSVELFIKRFEEFTTSGIPGAADVASALSKRGLNSQEFERIKRVLADTMRFAGSLPKPQVDPAVLRAASQKQLDGYVELNKWYVDWSTTLRPKLGYHEKLQLGLTFAPRRGTRRNHPNEDSSE